MNKFALSALATLAAVTVAGAASACPDYSEWGVSSYTATGSSLYTPTTFGVRAGGSNSLRSCGFSGEGYVISAPDFTFDLSGMSGYALEVRVVSDCDAVLLVNAPDSNWYYDDDSNGNLDPSIWLSSVGSGYLDVWVGTYNGAYCDAEVTLETF